MEKCRESGQPARDACATNSPHLPVLKDDAYHVSGKQPCRTFWHHLMHLNTCSDLSAEMWVNRCMMNDYALLQMKRVRLPCLHRTAQVHVGDTRCGLILAKHDHASRRASYRNVFM